MSPALPAPASLLQVPWRGVSFHSDAYSSRICNADRATHAPRMPTRLACRGGSGQLLRKRPGASEPASALRVRLAALETADAALRCVAIAWPCLPSGLSSFRWLSEWTMPTCAHLQRSPGCDQRAGMLRLTIAAAILLQAVEVVRSSGCRAVSLPPVMQPRGA
jgi:hypothetical protein